jgi:Bacterial PH domain
MMDYDIANELSPILGPNEKLAWTGRPRGGFILRRSDAFLIPFSLFWGGFAFFWEGGVMFTNAPFFFKLWGIPFVAVGIYIIAGRFFVDAKKRANTIYGITQDRIIIRSGIFSKDIKSLAIRTLSDISMSQKWDNSGTISLGPTDNRFSMMQGLDWPGVKQTPRLEFIPEVKSVYDIIIDLQRKK